MRKKTETSRLDSKYKPIAVFNKPGKKYRILVADDDSSIRDIFKIILEREGYDLELLADASHIINGNFRTPDLFMVDKLLSGMDGLDVCRFLKSRDDTKQIPVMMISALPDIGVLSKKAGADDFLEKPFDVTNLLQKVRSLIQQALKQKAAY